jgi:hypothetical protein
MDIGSGIALGALCVSAAPVCIVALRSKKNGNGHCSDHSGVCKQLEGFGDWLEKIENKLDRVIEGRIGGG